MSHFGSSSALRTGREPRSASRQRSPSSPPSVPLLPQGPEALVLPEGPVGEEAAELLQEFVHPHHGERESLIGDVERGGQQTAVESAKLPWWKRPSPWWFLAAIPVSSMAVSAMMAPRIEIYTRLACEVYSPNTTIPEGMEPGAMVFASILRDRIAFVAPSESGDLEDLCASDPVVQAAAAQLNMVYMTCMGILACLTTAAWGSLSDRYGRTRVLGIAIFGLLFTDLNFISVTKFRRSLPGGYWFFIVGAIVEGCLGGMAAASAGIHAYIADCTDANTRSRFFSLFLGLLFCGIALGPTVGGLLVRYTGNLLVPFYFATFMHIFYAIALWFIVPESLSQKQMIEARESHAAKVEQQRLADPARPFLPKFDMLLTALSPLKVFLSPPLRKDSKPGKPKKDWNLLFIALSYGGTIMLMGSYNYKFQYLSATFGWKSEQIGYWLSIVGVTRALYLTAILPVLIKLFKPKPIQLPVEASEPLQPENTGSVRSGDETAPPPHQLQSLSFDLSLARFALIIDIISYILLPLAPNALMFTVYTMMGCLGTGFSPAIQSVAMGLYTQQGGTELGKLFGALSVMSALCSQILGPALFGLTYMKTAGTMPTAIFYLAGLAVTFSFICLSFVRLPKEMEVIEDEEERPIVGASLEMVREETLVDTEIPVILIEEDRGGKISDS